MHVDPLYSDKYLDGLGTCVVVVFAGMRRGHCRLGRGGDEHGRGDVDVGGARRGPHPQHPGQHHHHLGRDAVGPGESPGARTCKDTQLTVSVLFFLHTLHALLFLSGADILAQLQCLGDD